VDLVLTKFTLPVWEVLRAHEEPMSRLGEAGWHSVVSVDKREETRDEKETTL